MSTATDQVQAFCDSPGPLWFPGLAPVLVEFSITSASDLGGASYGTARWLRQDPGSALIIAATVGRRPANVELLPEALVIPFQHLAPALNPDRREFELLGRSLEFLDAHAGPGSAVCALVRSIHVLQAEAGYDVSHSDPEIPYSIFVSIPAPGERDAVLRVAESVLHETMHLQLTLMEEFVPMVAADLEGWSPWQGRARPARGLLHGLYVFAVIHEFMGSFSDDPVLARASARRRREIGDEVSQLEDVSDGLSATGRRLWLSCIERTLGQAR